MTQEIERRLYDEFMVSTYDPSEMIPVRARGLDLWDQSGRHYLDFTSGVAVTNLGHSYPGLVDVLTGQGSVLWHAGNSYTNEPVLRLAQTLAEVTFADRSFFCNSGAEANEAALKLARKYACDKFGKGKSRIVSCLNSFHGRTLFSVSVGGQPKYTEGFGPLPEQIEHIGFNDIEAARNAVNEEVCAVVVEPVQGEGGVIPATTEYLQALREFCNQSGALLIFDEIQSGMGRTGYLFAYMGLQVTPDILTTAKGLGNGYPVGAMLTTHEVSSHLGLGSHGTTLGGNPMAASIALEVVKTINTPVFLARVRQSGAQLLFFLENIVRDYPHIFNCVRGVGLMYGLVTVDGCPGQAKAVVKVAERHGLLLLIANVNVVRILPALIVSDEQLEDANRLLRNALDEFAALKMACMVLSQ